MSMDLYKILRIQSNHAKKEENWAAEKSFTYQVKGLLIDE
jgi:hypothetical protein